MRISENMVKKISNLSLMGQAQCFSVATEFHFQHHFLNKKSADSITVPSRFVVFVQQIWQALSYFPVFCYMTGRKKNKKIATSHQNIGAISSNSEEIVFKVSFTVTVLSDMKAGL